MREIVLDTSAYSLFKRGDLQAANAIQQADKILLPATVIGELLAGFSRGNRQAQNVKELDEFLFSSRVTVTEVTQKTAERYALIYLWLRNQGKPIPTNDLWIAASAMENGADLVSADAHFELLPQIHLIKLG